MIIGVGIDLVRTERIAPWMDREGMVERFFHPDEIEYAKARGAEGAASLAARFAAKEAFGKAMGSGLTGLRLRDICVRSDVRGAPYITLEGAAAAVLSERGGGVIHCSLSHEGDYAVAFVVIEKDQPHAG